MSQKSFLDIKKNHGRISICWGGSTHIWKIPYVSSFLFLKASLNPYHVSFIQSTSPQYCCLTEVPGSHSVYLLSTPQPAPGLELDQRSQQDVSDVIVTTSDAAIRHE